MKSNPENRRIIRLKRHAKYHIIGQPKLIVRPLEKGPTPGLVKVKKETTNETWLEQAINLVRLP